MTRVVLILILAIALFYANPTVNGWVSDQWNQYQDKKQTQNLKWLESEGKIKIIEASPTTR